MINHEKLSGTRVPLMIPPKSEELSPLRRKQAPSRTSRDSLLDRPQGNLHTGTGKSKPDEGPSYIYSVQVPRGFFKKSSQKARPEGPSYV